MPIRSRHGSYSRTTRRNLYYKNNKRYKVPSGTKTNMNKKNDLHNQQKFKTNYSKAGFSLPWLVAAYLVGSCSVRKNETVIHRHIEDNGGRSKEDDTPKEMPQLSEDDPCYTQYQHMSKCLESNNANVSECQSVIKLMEQCAIFNSNEV